MTEPSRVSQILQVLQMMSYAIASASFHNGIIKTDSQNVQAITGMKAPQNLQDPYSYLGLENYRSCFTQSWQISSPH